jgi:hypothetical protein
MTSPTLTPTKFTDADYYELQHVANGGDISKASKAELERFAVMLSRPGAHGHFGTSYEQVCGTVRMLLMVRMSEASNREASRLSKIALYIAIAALFAGVVQAVVSIFQLFS